MRGLTATEIETAQTFLFVPANRPDRYAKAVAAGADVVVLDLEDAVAPAEKHDARRNVQSWLDAGNTAMVRINAVGTRWHDDDVRVIAHTAAAVMLPKAENPHSIAAIALAAPRTSVVALIESAAGVCAAADIARTASVTRLAFGSIDLATQLGVDPDDRGALHLARSTLVMASAAAGLPSPIDGVTANFTDPARSAEDARYARRLGMTAKLCIHPVQIGSVREELASRPDEIAWAQRVLQTVAGRESATAMDGAMVDAPVVHRARRILDAAANHHAGCQGGGVSTQ